MGNSSRVDSLIPLLLGVCDLLLQPSTTFSAKHSKEVLPVWQLPVGIVRKVLIDLFELLHDGVKPLDRQLSRCVKH